MRLLKSQRDALVSEAVIVLKSVILSLTTSVTSTTASTDPQRLVARLANGLDSVTNARARASVYWLVGMYAGVEDNKGLGWEGVASWVPDVLRKGIKGFADEVGSTPEFTADRQPTLAKLQILTLATKLVVLSSSPQVFPVSKYLLALARYDKDYDVRDRARFLHALLRGVRDEKKALKNGDDQGTESEEEDLGGVVLRREQVRVILLGKREAGEDAVTADQADYEVGSLSRITKRKLTGYTPLPEWTDDPTDSSLRDVEVEKPPVLAAPVASYDPTPRPVPPPHSFSTSVAGRVASSVSIPQSSDDSPIGSLPQHTTRAKFKDLDKFLDSESETEDESDEEDRCVISPMASLPQPQY